MVTKAIFMQVTLKTNLLTYQKFLMYMHYSWMLQHQVILCR